MGRSIMVSVTLKMVALPEESSTEA